MSKIVNAAKCKLGKLGIDKVNSVKYGISCNDLDIDTLQMLLWASNLHCANTKLLDRLTASILKYCKECKPKRYKEVKTTLNPDYSLWYTSPTYVACALAQLQQNGYTTYILNLCSNLNVIISQEKLCKDIIVLLAQSKVDCSVLARIDVEKVCKVNTPLLTALANNCNVKPTITTTTPDCNIPTNITQEQVCYTPEIELFHTQLCQDIVSKIIQYS